MSINFQTSQWAENNHIPHLYQPETTSTNDIAKNHFPTSQQEFFLYLTDHQSQGRGRGQRRWQNLAQGEVLLSTWCFRTDRSPQPILTPLLGLALYQCLKRFLPQKDLRLKPPNDIYCGDAKLSGLLVEVTQQGSSFYVAVGLGLNVLASPDIDIATSNLTDLGFSLQDWEPFCHSLYTDWRQAIAMGQREALNTEQQKQLLEALNCGLSDDIKYLDISPRCDLKTPSGTISWMDL